MRSTSGADRIELLAPARNLECGRAAVDCGADALYAGAPRFGARAAAGNSLDDIAALVRHAHTYWARVYITLNTLLFDNELVLARKLAWELHDIGVDGLIIQDVGLLEGEMPPLPLIASTQMHNYTPERVAFLEQVGFRRAILARELDLQQILAIRKAAPAIELEFFVHGALCVAHSGQCCLSYALGGRSGNRGQCAQPCRRAYDLVDANEHALARGRHLLSIRDLNLSDHLPALLDAGITSFKIEGRLKDKAYVANIVSHYRQRIDDAIGSRGLRRSSSGRSEVDFKPDPDRTFNRGYCTYFLSGRNETIGSHATPKMVGEEIGLVTSVKDGSFSLDSASDLRPGDGLCFFDDSGALRGTTVNAVRGKAVTPDKPEAVVPGRVLYRNHDHAFFAEIARSRMERRIGVRLKLEAAAGSAALRATDEDGNEVQVSAAEEFGPAENQERAKATIRKQLVKAGETEFEITEVEVAAAAAVPFMPVSVLNRLRREALDALRAERERNRPAERRWTMPNDVAFPVAALDYLGNVLNADAAAFYRRHGVTEIEPAAESGLDMRGRKVMTTRYCLKYELGMCPREGPTARPPEPLSLVDDEGRRLELHFDCGRCEMQVWFEG